jgi:hypothetical protein
MVSLLVVLTVVALPWLLTRCALSSDANFADVEEFTGNRLGAGSVELAVTEAIDVDGISVLNGQPSTPSPPQPFSAFNMAPGDSVTGALAVANTGTLPIRYWMTASASPASSPLTDWLLYDVWRGERCRDGIAAADEVYITNLILGGDEVPILGRPGTDTLGLRLEPDQSTMICLGARLPLSAPNETQAARVDIELVVFAQHSPAPTGPDPVVDGNRFNLEVEE